MIEKLMRKLGYVKENSLLVEVTNKMKYRSANKKYYLMTLNGIPYLFTNHNLIIAQQRAKKNPEDLS